MTRNDDGQFEMLLGNKQLLSILFIVMILLGVFFTMGYVLGRNSVASETTVAASTAKPPAASTTETRNNSPFASEDRPRLAQEATPPVPTPAPVEQTQPSAAPHPATAPPAAAAAEPAPGQSYLQVAAIKRPEAEVIGDVLRKKGFPCLIAPHPTEPVFRVLVGPLRDVDDISKMRVDLRAIGFKPILRKF